jgi:hypothetical protein
MCLIVATPKRISMTFVFGIQTDSKSPNSSLINTVPVQPQLPTALKSSLIDLLTKFMMAYRVCVT